MYIEFLRDGNNAALACLEFCVLYYNFLKGFNCVCICSFYPIDYDAILKLYLILYFS